MTETPPIRSGVARVAGVLLDGLRRRGYEVEVFSALSLGRLEIGEFRLSSLIFRPKYLFKNLKDYDIINVHGPAPTFSDVFLLLALLLRRLRKHNAVVIYTYHSEIDIKGLGWLCRIYNWLQKWLSRFCDHTIVTTPSYATMLHYHRTDPHRQLSIIPWGTNTTQPFNPDKRQGGKFRVITVGQLRPYKGLNVLLRAMQGLSGDIHLDIVGTGHSEFSYKQMAAELGLSNVTFHGALSDSELLTLMNQAHVLVLPSITRAEAFGIVLLEAMAVGCVPVASDLPGVRDVIGKIGFTFPVGDASALQNIIQSLQNQPDRWFWRSQQARLKAENFSWERVINSYERLFSRYYIANRMRILLENNLSLGVAVTDLLTSLVSQFDASGAVVEEFCPATNQLNILGSFGTISSTPPEAYLAVNSGKTILVDRPFLSAYSYPDVFDRLDEPPGPTNWPQAYLIASLGPACLLRIERSETFTIQDKEWLAGLAALIAPYFSAIKQSTRLRSSIKVETPQTVSTNFPSSDFQSVAAPISTVIEY